MARQLNRIPPSLMLLQSSRISSSDSPNYEDLNLFRNINFGAQWGALQDWRVTESSDVNRFLPPQLYPNDIVLINIDHPIQNAYVSSTTTYTVNPPNEELIIDSDSDSDDNENDNNNNEQDQENENENNNDGGEEEEEDQENENIDDDNGDRGIAQENENRNELNDFIRRHDALNNLPNRFLPQADWDDDIF